MLKADIRPQCGKQSRVQASPTYILNLACPRAHYDLSFEPAKTFVEFKAVIGIWEYNLNIQWPMIQHPFQISANGQKGILEIFHLSNIPLVLIAALCRDISNPFGDYAKCAQDGNAYISFGQWVGAIVLYTYVFQMLALPSGRSFDVIEQDKLPVKNNPKLYAPHEEVPLLTQEAERVNEDLSKDGKIKQFLKYWYEKLKLKQIVQPPIIVSILAIVIGCVPFLKQMIFNLDAPLYFFTDSCLILS